MHRGCLVQSKIVLMVATGLWGLRRGGTRGGGRGRVAGVADLALPERQVSRQHVRECAVGGRPDGRNGQHPGGRGFALGAYRRQPAKCVAAGAVHHLDRGRVVRGGSDH